MKKKVKGEKEKILSVSRKRGHDGKNDDDGEFDGNNGYAYRDSEGKVTPSFKTHPDCTVNNLLQCTYTLSKL